MDVLCVTHDCPFEVKVIPVWFLVMLSEFLNNFTGFSKNFDKSKNQKLKVGQNMFKIGQTYVKNILEVKQVSDAKHVLTLTKKF